MASLNIFAAFSSSSDKFDSSSEADVCSCVVADTSSAIDAVSSEIAEMFSMDSAASSFDFKTF